MYVLKNYLCIIYLNIYSLCLAISVRIETNIVFEISAECMFCDHSLILANIEGNPNEAVMKLAPCDNSF